MPKKNNKKLDDDDDIEIDDIEEKEEDVENEDDEEDVEYEELEELEEQKMNGNSCNIEDAINDDEEFFDNSEEIEVPSESGIEFVSKENRISVNRLTKYEMVRILGERTKQLTMGAKPLIKNYQTLSYDKIAQEELMYNMIPFKIKRPLPNGKYEIWTLDELQKDHLLHILEL